MNVVAKSIKHAAPGPYLGFALQPVRLCFHLLTCPKGASVSLEYLDDVAVHQPDGAIILEQTKSALKQNPLSNWAEDLWKTLANWLDSVSKGEIDVVTCQFRLYVTPSRQGDFAQKLSVATTPSDIASLTALIKSKRGKLKKSPGCELFLQRFLGATEDERVSVVTRFTVSSEDADPVEPLRLLLRTTVAPSLVDPLCEAAIGMAKERADRLIRDGKTALLDGDIFKTEFRAFVQKTNLPGMLTSFAATPGEEQVASILSGRPTFIRQLEIIEAPEEDRVRAVSDLLRTSADKSNWAEQGLVFEGSLKNWDSDLVHRHSLISGEIADLNAGSDATVRGRLAYRRCAQLQPPLDGRAVPGHFVHGCFNSLADEMRLGWHPEYKKVLGEDDK